MLVSAWSLRWYTFRRASVKAEQLVGQSEGISANLCRRSNALFVRAEREQKVVLRKNRV